VLLIEFLLVIGFIVFTVLKSLAETNKRKQETARRTIQRPGRQPESPVFTAETFNPESSSDRFPDQMAIPWEEEPEQKVGRLEELPLEEFITEESGQEGYTLEGDSLEGISLEGHSSEGKCEVESLSPSLGSGLTNLAEPKVPTQVTMPKMVPNYAFQLTSEQIWQGFIWSEILMPPKCKRGSR